MVKNYAAGWQHKREAAARILTEVNFHPGLARWLNNNRNARGDARRQNIRQE